jgi:hypothetical protein
MKKSVTIFLLVSMVSLQTPVGQLLKLPLLIEHFIEHQQQHGVSLLAFLQDHYTENHHDADLPEDEQLPFKNITVYTLGYAIMPGVMKPAVGIALLADIKVVFTERYTPQQNTGSIFHPPRA